MSQATTSSGFLRRELTDALASSIGSTTESNFTEKADYICSILLELVSSNNETTRSSNTAMCTLACSIVEAYASALVPHTTTANLWVLRGIDEIINDLQVMHTERDVSIRLLVKLVMIATRDIARQKSSLADNIITQSLSPKNQKLLPTELIMDRQTRVIYLTQSLHPDARDTYDTEPCELRDAILRTLLTSFVHDNIDDAKMIITMIMTRCGRTKSAYDQMHKYLMSEMSEEDDERRIWHPLGFCLSSSNQEERKKKSPPTIPDVAWGIWRTIYKYAHDEDVRDFVARMASCYAFRWTPARRHLNSNLLIHTLHVAMGRCTISSQDIFEPDFMDLVDVAEVRMIQQLDK